MITCGSNNVTINPGASGGVAYGCGLTDHYYSNYKSASWLVPNIEGYVDDMEIFVPEGEYYCMFNCTIRGEDSGGNAKDVTVRFVITDMLGADIFATSGQNVKSIRKAPAPGAYYFDIIMTKKVPEPSLPVPFVVPAGGAYITVKAQCSGGDTTVVMLDRTLVLMKYGTYTLY